MSFDSYSRILTDLSIVCYPVDRLPDYLDCMYVYIDEYNKWYRSGLSYKHFRAIMNKPKANINHTWTRDGMKAKFFKGYKNTNLPPRKERKSLKLFYTMSEWCGSTTTEMVFSPSKNRQDVKDLGGYNSDIYEDLSRFSRVEAENIKSVLSKLSCISTYCKITHR